MSTLNRDVQRAVGMLQRRLDNYEIATGRNIPSEIYLYVGMFAGEATRNHIQLSKEFDDAWVAIAAKGLVGPYGQEECQRLFFKWVHSVGDNTVEEFIQLHADIGMGDERWD